MTERAVIVAGVGPVPPHEPEKLHAPGLRLWGFADHLERRGHRVVLCEAMFGGAEARARPELFAGRRIAHEILPLDLDGAAARLRQIAARERAGALVASTDIINAAAAIARLPIPIWLDFNGHPMTERQMLTRVFNSDDGLIDQWRMVLPSLLGGDRFSVCCRAQKGASIGELGAVGRLNRHTTGLDLVEVIYPGLAVEPPEGKPGAIRGKLAPEGATIVLSAGGFNTWFDEATLFRGAELAMAREPAVHFVAVGGAIAGHNEKTFAAFRERVAASRFAERFHFAGWVPWAALADHYRESDLAVNLDLPTYEGVFGWRNRTIEWAAAGVPIATTTVSELGEDLASRGLVEPIACGDAEALAEAIVRCGARRAEFRARAGRARAYVKERYDYAKQIEPITRWLEAPSAAPDLPPPRERPGVKGAIRPNNSLAEAAENAGAATNPTPARRSRLRRLFG